MKRIINLSILTFSMIFWSVSGDSVKRTVYESSGLIEIRLPTAEQMGESNQGDSKFIEYAINNTILKLKSDKVIRRAMETLNPDIDELERNIQGMQKTLHVENVKGTSFVKISLGSQKPDGLNETINAILEAFEDQMLKEKIPNKDDVEDDLRKLKMNLKGDVDHLINMKVEIIEKADFDLDEKNQIYNNYNNAKARWIEAEKQFQNTKNQWDMFSNTHANFNQFSDKDLHESELWRSLKSEIERKHQLQLMELKKNVSKEKVSERIKKLDKDLNQGLQNLRSQIKNDMLKHKKRNYEKKEEQLKLRMTVAEMNRNKAKEKMHRAKEDTTENAKLKIHYEEINRKLKFKLSQIEEVEKELLNIIKNEKKTGDIQVYSKAVLRKI